MIGRSSNEVRVAKNEPSQVSDLALRRLRDHNVLALLCVDEVSAIPRKAFWFINVKNYTGVVLHEAV